MEEEAYYYFLSFLYEFFTISITTTRLQLLFAGFEFPAKKILDLSRLQMFQYELCIDFHEMENQ